MVEAIRAVLTGIGTWIAFLSLAHLPQEENQPVWCTWDQMCFWCWKLLCRGNSETKEIITDTQDGQHKRNQKQQISSLKHSKEEKTKEGRDNRCIRVNTLSQIRLLLACCSLSLAFVAKAKALIQHCIGSTVIVNHIHILCNPTWSVYTLREAKDTKTTMLDPFCTLRSL